MKLIKRKIVETYDFELPEVRGDFYFRLEIHKHDNCYTGYVYRLERLRVEPTFHQDINGNPTLIDDTLIFIKDEFIDERKLTGKTIEDVVNIFLRELEVIFDV